MYKVHTDSDNAMPATMEQLKEAVEAMNSNGFKEPKALSPSELAALYQRNSNARLLRDRVDDIIELVNEGNDLISMSPHAAERKLQTASSMASGILSKIDQFKPARGQDISPEQQLTMSLFIDISGALAQALTSLGTLKEMTGSPREAMILYQGALPQCEVMNDSGTAFTCRVGIGNCHRALHQFERAIQILKLELETARIHRDEVGEAICCNSLSRCYTSLPFDREKFELNVAAATEYAARDVELSEADGNLYPAQLGSARAQLASCLRKGGDIVQAFELYKVAIEGLNVGGDLSAELMTRLELTEMLLCEGRGAEVPDFTSEAYKQGAKALEVSERLNDKGNALNALEMMSRSGKGNKEDSEKLEASLREARGGKLDKVCVLCDKALDWGVVDADADDKVFTAVKMCMHSYHRGCIAAWVGQDNLRCPVHGCEKGADMRKHVKSDPGVLLRLAKGEHDMINCF